MTSKFPTASAYRQTGYSDDVRRTCLFIATKLGDYLEDVVVVGGLVPSLLITIEAPNDIPAHPGTLDLDIGLSLGILDEQRYQGLTARLREAGFEPNLNASQHRTYQEWRITYDRRSILVDFLIAPSTPQDAGGQLRHIEGDFAAVITPGLHLAFLDRKEVVLEGLTIRDEQATRTIWVCGPGAYVVLKSLAFRNRGANKDAYDLFYVLRYVGTKEVIRHLRPLIEDETCRKALTILKEDFTTHDSIGASRVAEFVGDPLSVDETKADVVGSVLELLDALGAH